MENFIGIDLGTTYSAVSTIDSYGKPVVLKNSEGERLTPSAVYFDPDGGILVGAEAKDMMTNAGAEVAVFFKRFMGDSSFSYTVNGRSHSATDLSAILLAHLRNEAEKALGGPVRKAVITVPAYFNDLQRNETVKAARNAGLDVLRIINEPTAAAITYGVNQNHDCRLLVYDLGGGTFDVTVLEVKEGVMRVIATGGDHKLGGKDWDDRIVSYVADRFESEHGMDPLEDTETFNDLLFMAENAKKQLSSATQAVINLRYNGCRGRYVLTRDMFQEITAHLMENTQQKTEDVLREAGMTWHELDGVLLVGGSTKMTIVSDWVRKMSGKEPLRGVNVDEAVCIGAGIQAALDMEAQSRRFGLPGSSGKPKFTLPGGDIRIQDVMSHSLGAVAVSQEGDRYVNSIIIPRNRTIPVTERRPFQLKVKKPNQTMDIYVTQGETSEITDCTVVGHYVISGMVPSQLPAVINVGYAYDENGIINVSASQVTSRGEQPLRVEKQELPDDMGWLYGRPKGAGEPMCVYLCIDLSGSMAGERIKTAREASKEFIRNINLASSEIAIVGFSDKVELYDKPCNNEDTLNVLIDKRLNIGSRLGYGNEADPVSYCYDIMHKICRQMKCIMLILTDGYWDNSACRKAVKHSDKCRDKGIDIIGIGIGSADEEFLRRISTISAMTDLDSLTESFGTIAQELSESGSAASISLRK